MFNAACRYLFWTLQCIGALVVSCTPHLLSIYAFAISWSWYFRTDISILHHGAKIRISLHVYLEYACNSMVSHSCIPVLQHQLSSLLHAEASLATTSTTSSQRRIGERGGPTVPRTSSACASPEGRKLFTGTASQDTFAPPSIPNNRMGSGSMQRRTTSCFGTATSGEEGSPTAKTAPVDFNGSSGQSGYSASAHGRSGRTSGCKSHGNRRR